MHILGYIVLCLTTAYTALYVFSFGWSPVQASFPNVFYHVAAFTITAGIIAGIPKKAIFKIASIFALLGPVGITAIMFQGIMESRAFDLLHWAAIPIGGALLSMIAFLITKKLMTTIQRQNIKDRD
jgi:hypothetical protein